MKKLFLLLILFIFVININSQSESIKVMSYNIRCGYCEDSTNVNHWSKRKFLVAKIIANINPDLIGLQEAEQFQIKDLTQMLGDYDWYGIGREDGKEKGESTAILYRRDRFILDGKKTLWLSENPEIISKGWDAAFNRTVTITLLEDITTSKEFYFLNTHFDHVGEEARTKSSKLFVDEINKFPLDVPVILTGDFNYTAKSDGYRIITSKLYDAMNISKQKSTGGNMTFNGFGKDIQPDNKIDFIFVNDKIEVMNHVIDTTIVNGLYPSDHYPVIAEIKLK